MRNLVVRIHQNEALVFKHPPLLRPLLKLLVVSTLPLEPHPREPILRHLKRLEARVCAAHDGITQILEAMPDVREPVDAIVERLNVCII